MFIRNCTRNFSTTYTYGLLYIIFIVMLCLWIFVILVASMHATHIVS